jgi:hypothetical protein
MESPYGCGNTQTTNTCIICSVTHDECGQFNLFNDLLTLCTITPADLTTKVIPGGSKRDRILLHLDDGFSVTKPKGRKVTT